MATSRVTGFILLVAIIVLIGWDAYVAIRTGSVQGATISELVLAMSLHHPAIPFGVGFVAGHLFWPQGVDG